VDAGIIAAIIGLISALLVVGLGAVFSLITYPRQKQVDRDNYSFEKKTERETELRTRRMKEYERYLKAYRTYQALYDFGRSPADDSKEIIAAVNEYWFSYSNLFHIASDRVLEAASDFHKYAWIEDPSVTDETVERFKELYAEMIVRMRTDVSESTNFSNEQLQDRLPFNFSPAKPQEPEPAGSMAASLALLKHLILRFFSRILHRG